MTQASASSRQIAKPIDNYQQITSEKTNVESSPAVRDFAAVWGEIERLGLERHVGELDAQGYTIVPPEMVAGPAFIERLKSAILDVAERRHGIRPDMTGVRRDIDREVPFGQILFYLLFEDDVFQEAVLNPTVLALSSYLVGRSCILSNCVAILKGPGGGDLALHSDSLMVPNPLPPYAQVCNTNWLLTDYTRDNGALCFVPGSHRYCRHPAPGEGIADRVPVEAPAGSIVVWHGNTWHGAFGRKNDGLRMSFNSPMMRSYMQPEEAYREDVTPEILARNPPRFATLMGKHIDIPWRAEGTDYQTVYPGQSLWD